MSTPTRLLFVPFVLLSCAAPGRGRADMVDIEGSAAALAEWFDQERDTPRAILLLSPV